MKSVNKYAVLMVLCTLFLLSTPLQVNAAEMTLQEALIWGTEHSGSLQKLRDQVQNLKTSLTNMELTLDWQFDLKSSANYGTLPPALRKSDSDGTKATQAELTLQGSKSFLWGLNLQPKLTYSEQDPFELDQLDENVNFSITATQLLFPWGPSQAEQEYIQTSNQYQQAVESFKSQAEWEQIGWIEGYLNLIRLQERLEVAQTSLELALEQLENIQQQRAIGESSEINLLNAQIQVKQAESKHFQAVTNYQQQKQGWYNKLNLPADSEVEISISNPYLAQVHNRVEVNSLWVLEKDQMRKRVWKSHYQLQAIEQDQQLAQRQIKWAERKTLPQIQLSGSYDYQNEDWNTGIQLTYNLSQKQNKLKIEDQQVKLNNLLEEEKRLKKDVQLQLDQYQSLVELSHMEIEEKELAFQKTELEAKLATQQWEVGLITEQEYQQKQLNHQQAVVDLRIAEDQLFISQLRLVNFLGNRLPY